METKASFSYTDRTRRRGVVRRVAGVMAGRLSILSGTLFVLLLIAIGVPITSGAYLRQVPTQAITITKARVIEVGESGVGHPFGLAYWSRTETFVTLSPGQGEGESGAAELVTFNFFGDDEQRTTLAAPVYNDLNLAVDGATNSLYLLDASSPGVNAVRVDDSGLVGAGPVESLGADLFGVADARGMTVDPGSGRLFVLDSEARRIVWIDPGRPQGPPGRLLAPGTGQSGEIALGDDVPAGLRGIAFNPADGHLYLLHPAGRTLYGLTGTGQVAATYPLPQDGAEDPQGMVFAPSGDLTDDPGQMSLYVADSAGDGRGRIVELAFRQTHVLPDAVQTTDAVLVQIIDSSQFEPPSPDTAGIAYISDENRLMASDSEVNEMPLYEGVNVFEISLTGELFATFDTTTFSDEPTGVTYKPEGRRLFFSDDDDDEVYELNPGADGAYGTADDIVTSFDTRAFGSHDPEGLAYEGVENRLFIVDGVNAEVYVVWAGPNGVFDGLDVDDEVSQFDTESLGIDDLEGIEYSPDTGTLYIVGKPADVVAEVTTGGDLVQFIDISEAEPRTPGGIAYGRRSNDPGLMSLYITERGVDNDTNPDENDGKIYEIGLPIAASSPTPTPTNPPTSTPTATSAATGTATPTPTMAPPTPTMAPPTPTPPRESKEIYLRLLPFVANDVTP